MAIFIRKKMNKENQNKLKMEKLLKKTNKSGKIVNSELGNCWEWTGLKKEGYGLYSIYSVHRLSYELNKGIIPDNMCVRHKCDNRCCLNPEHLEIGTVEQNIADKVSRGRATSKGVKGVRNKSSKLSDADIKFIRDNENSRGEKYAKELGKRFDVKFQHIYRIWNNERRKEETSNISDKEDFFKRDIHKKIIINNELGECWETERDRQIISFNNKKRLSHRVAYELENGEITDGLMVRHKCDNSKCINPKHLELGNHSDNMNDRNERGKTAKGSSHGGASITEEIAKNIYKNKDKKSSIETAKEFNITKNIVYNIWSKKTWKHIHENEVIENEIVNNKIVENSS